MKITIPNLLIAFSFALMVMGCYTEKKASRQVVKAYVEYPEIVSGHCGLWFEPIIMTKDSFIYKQGKTIYKQGEPVYVQVDCDSVLLAAKSLHNGEISKKPLHVKIPCPPCDSVRIDTAYISSRNTEVNKATEQALRLRLDNLQEELIKVTHGRKTWRIIALISILLMVLYIVLKFVIGKFR